MPDRSGLPRCFLWERVLLLAAGIALLYPEIYSDLAAALMKLGIPTLSAHMFVLYYAILSEITPPVCLSAYAGASIAGANAMQTGWRAFRLGIVAYIIPFIFVFQPALLLTGEFSHVAQALVTSFIGVITLAGACPAARKAVRRAPAGFPPPG